ncbi:MAG: rhamnogalacturonan acetylesterase [Sediminibacterium sp.]|nr:rhamnogalacturonan acetylesterase [Sediminibacterium sp.]
MKQIGYTLIIILLVGFTIPFGEHTQIFLAGDSTMSVKEKKAFPETGWGMPFADWWDSSVTVINKAKNGRSTKTFIQEGIWSSIMNEMKAGDYVFIQFGHNDESPEKKDRYTSPDSFQLNLIKFVQEVHLKKGFPVLVSPVSRRKFDKQGNAVATHEMYTPLVQAVANQLQVPYINLDSVSRAMYQELGPDKSQLIFLQLKAGEHPNYPDGKIDNTHFNELGARLIAQLVVKEIRATIPALAAKIIVRNSKT